MDSSREGWISIAEVSGLDHDAHKQIEDLLNKHNITNAVDGSEAYGIFVPKDLADAAIELIHNHAPRFPFPIRRVLVDSTGSEWIDYPTPSATEVLRVYASHNQFYVQDCEPRSTPGDSTFWTQETYERRLAIGDGLLGIGTGTYGFVTVRVEEHRSVPPLYLEKWDHVTECSLVVQSKFILIMGCLSRSGLFFEVEPGTYRVRACHANLAQSEQEMDDADFTGEFGDWYLIQFWSSGELGVTVPKKRAMHSSG